MENSNSFSGVLHIILYHKYALHIYNAYLCVGLSVMQPRVLGDCLVEKNQIELKKTTTFFSNSVQVLQFDGQI